MLEKRPRWHKALAPFFALLLPFCGQTENGGSSESHFLRHCQEGCPAGLSCICGVCTEECSEDSSCSGFPGAARCVERDSRCASSASSLCDAECSEDSACRALGAGFSCVDGRCRERDETGSGGAGPGDTRCEAFEDDAGWDIQLLITNRTERTLHFGREEAGCGSPPLFNVAQGTLLPIDFSCRNPCDPAQPGGCAAICLHPTTVTLAPGESLGLLWDGRYRVGTELPAACVDSASGAQVPIQCDRAQQVEPGPYTFSASAGTELDCSEVFPGEGCPACTPSAGGGGCETAGAVTRGVILRASTTVELDASYGVGRTGAPAQGATLPVRLDFEEPPACPLDLDAPIPVRVCTDERRSGTDKVDAEVWRQLDASSAPVAVVMTLNGGPTVCPLTECPATAQRTCPERDAEIAHLSALTLAAQRCVLEELERLGVTETETFWLGNSLAVSLNRAQVEAIAAHPHVIEISASETSTPPP